MQFHGNENVMKKAQEAKIANEKGTEREQIQLSVIEEYTNNEIIDLNLISNNIAEKNNKFKAKVFNNKNFLVVYSESTNAIYLVNEEGNVKELSIDVKFHTIYNEENDTYDIGIFIVPSDMLLLTECASEATAIWRTGNRTITGSTKEYYTGLDHEGKNYDNVDVFGVECVSYMILTGVPSSVKGWELSASVTLMDELKELCGFDNVYSDVKYTYEISDLPSALEGLK